MPNSEFKQVHMQLVCTNLGHLPALGGAWRRGSLHHHPHPPPPPSIPLFSLSSTCLPCPLLSHSPLSRLMQASMSLTAAVSGSSQNHPSIIVKELPGERVEVFLDRV